MRRPNPPVRPSANALQNEDYWDGRMKELAAIDAECERVGSDAIRLKLIRGEWTGYQKSRAEEWLLVLDSSANVVSNRWMVVGVVSAVVAAILGLIQIFLL